MFKYLIAIKSYRIPKSDWLFNLILLFSNSSFFQELYCHLMAIKAYRILLQNIYIEEH